MNKLKYKGIEYQSTGEVEIAKFLDKMEIAFEYEFPIAVVENNKTKIWYPDFYLKEYQMVIEYFGMYAHNKHYRDNAEFKKDVYKDCGIQFVPLYKLNQNWEEYLLKTILGFIDYKSKIMTKKLEKLRNSKKVKSFIAKILPVFKKTPTKTQNENPKKSNFSQTKTNNNQKPKTHTKPFKKIKN